jgi:DNA-binding CsgD family transcriptional regulator
MESRQLNSRRRATDGRDVVMMAANGFERLPVGVPGPATAPPQKAGWERLCWPTRYVRHGGDNSPSLLLRAAERLAPFDAQLSREMFLEALGAAISAGRLGGEHGALAVAEAARRAAPAPTPRPRAPQVVDLLLDGLAARFTEGYAASLPELRRALQTFGEADDTPEKMRWLWLMFHVAADLWESDGLQMLVDKWSQLHSLTRPEESPWVTDSYRVTVPAFADDHRWATKPVGRSYAISTMTPDTYHQGFVESITGLQGHRTHSQTMIGPDVREATTGGEIQRMSAAQYSMAVLCNGLGQYERALSAAHQACELEDVGLYGWALTELVEAATRTRRRDIAVGALARLAERTQASTTDWGFGIEARSRALVSDGLAADALYREAIERLTRARIDVDLARSHLLYGEWLRRENRRIEAREQLRRAHNMLEEIGVEAFAERARRELLATGETVRKRTVASYGELTAQELQIARLAGARLTNSEIATQLFISVRTVEWHLGKVFTKLGVSSRKELRSFAA